MQIHIPLWFITFLLVPGNVFGHLCLIQPNQRGGFDVSGTGSNACFLQEAPCGGKAPDQDIYETWYGGQQQFIKWNQNFNHYEVGYPGYMDISIAPYNTSDWQLLAFLSDKYVYAQDYQHNFTTFIVVPDKSCDHCVVRARYVSHKPGEGTFYQCADVMVNSTKQPNRGNSVPDNSLLSHREYRSSIKKIKSMEKISALSTSSDMSLRGFSYSPFDSDTINLVNVTFDGQAQTFGQFHFGIHFNVDIKKRFSKELFQRKISSQYANDPNHMMYIVDSVCTVNRLNNLAVIYHEDGNMDTPAATYLEFDTHQGTILYKSKIENLINTPLSAIMASVDDTYYTVSVQPDPTWGYSFVVGQLTLSSNGTSLPYNYQQLIKSDQEPLYINFQWAELDDENGKLYVLMGNENAPARLLARIYTFDLKAKTVSNVELDVSSNAFMNIHYYKKTGKLYAVSPGTHDMLYFPKWSLIEIDPITGSVQQQFPLDKYGVFRGYFGGSVFDGIDQNRGILYHVMQMKDIDADAIAAVDIVNKKVTYSQMTNLRYIHNLALTNNSF